jgi:arabinofuranan 3-O-arabinosyltransferase
VERLRLTIAKVAGLGGQVRISEIKAGNARIPNPPPSQRLRGCVEIATIDGEPLEVRLNGSMRQLTAGEAMPLGNCAGPVRLSGGDHQIVSSTGWLVDLLGLSSPAPATRASQLPPPADLQVTGSSRSGLRIRTGPAGGPYYLVVGQGYDRRWRATMDGRRLGPPLLLDGYSVGWRITDQRPHRFEVTFGPQRAATLAQAVSAAGLVLVALLLLGSRLPRPLRAWRTGRSSAPTPAPDSAPAGEPDRRPRWPPRWRRR